MDRLAIAASFLLVAGCASTDYVNDGNIQSTTEVYSSNGMRVVIEHVTFDFLPGLPDETMYRWVATNGSDSIMCARARFVERVGDGGYSHNGIYELPPRSGRTRIAWVQNAYGSPAGARARLAVWPLNGESCAASAP